MLDFFNYGWTLLNFTLFWIDFMFAYLRYESDEKHVLIIELKFIYTYTYCFLNTRNPINPTRKNPNSNYPNPKNL